MLTGLGRSSAGRIRRDSLIFDGLTAGDYRACGAQESQSAAGDTKAVAGITITCVSSRVYLTCEYTRGKDKGEGRGEAGARM